MMMILELIGNFKFHEILRFFDFKMRNQKILIILNKQIMIITSNEKETPIRSSRI